MEQNIKKTFLSSVLFFLILSSWYNIRSVRNELAVENYGEGLLIPLLIVTTLTMIFVNPIYSWVASRANYIKIVFYTYSFFILNFIILYFIANSIDASMTDERIWLGRVFYVWSNIYSFFIVSIFWVLVINLFRDLRSRNYYGFIMAGGSVGAMLGSQLSKWLSSSFISSGITQYLLVSSFFLLVALILAVYMVKTFSNDALTKNVGGSSFDGLRNIISNKDVRLIAIYSWFFTFLMTIQWIAAIPIINDYSELAPERIILFSNIEQLVTPLTFIVQTFLTYFVISKYGIKLIFIIYGVLFSLVFILYGFFPSVAIVVLCQTLLRVFEYGFNKPAREIAYSQLRKGDRYKSTVFIDTFITRFGDLSGSIFMGIGKVIFISVTYLPIVAIPLAFIHTYVARLIFLRNTFKDL